MVSNHLRHRIAYKKTPASTSMASARRMKIDPVLRGERAAPERHLGLRPGQRLNLDTTPNDRFRMRSA
jgi:hypothetical protein